MWSGDAARLMNRVSCRALVWSLAEQTGLVPSLGRVRFRASKVRSDAVKWTACVTEPVNLNEAPSSGIY
jgi:hypothetical protein